jgi:hypothetical protein
MERRFITVDEEGFTRFTCPLCEGVSHPVTGCVYSPTFVVCGPCTRVACRWIQTWTAGKGRRRGPSFYEHVRTS